MLNTQEQIGEKSESGSKQQLSASPAHQSQEVIEVPSGGVSMEVQEVINNQFAPTTKELPTVKHLTDNEMSSYYELCKNWVDSKEYKDIPIDRITRNGMHPIFPFYSLCSLSGFTFTHTPLTTSHTISSKITIEHETLFLLLQNLTIFYASSVCFKKNILFPNGGNNFVIVVNIKVLFLSQLRPLLYKYLTFHGHMTMFLFSSILNSNNISLVATVKLCG